MVPTVPPRSGASPPPEGSPRKHLYVRADDDTRRRFRALCVTAATNQEAAIGDYMRRCVARGRLE